MIKLYTTENYRYFWFVSNDFKKSYRYRYEYPLYADLDKLGSLDYNKLQEYSNNIVDNMILDNDEEINKLLLEITEADLRSIVYNYMQNLYFSLKNDEQNSKLRTRMMDYITNEGVMQRFITKQTGISESMLSLFKNDKTQLGLIDREKLDGFLKQKGY